jgi:hypothetical protein
MLNNPPINIEAIDVDDDNYQNSINKDIRKMSRKILLDYPENVRPIKENDTFKLKNVKLHDNIREYVKTEEENMRWFIKRSLELCLIL